MARVCNERGRDLTAKACKHCDPPCLACVKIRERVRAYDRKHRRAHNARSRLWKERHPVEVLAANYRSNRSRRARKRTLGAVADARDAGCEVVDVIDLQVLYDRDDGMCGLCLQWVPAIGSECAPSEEATIDHIIPKAWKGSHSWSNVQLAHKGCNSRKGTRIIPKPDVSDIPF